MRRKEACWSSSTAHRWRLAPPLLGEDSGRVGGLAIAGGFSLRGRAEPLRGILEEEGRFLAQGARRLTDAVNAWPLHSSFSEPAQLLESWGLKTRKCVQGCRCPFSLVCFGSLKACAVTKVKLGMATTSSAAGANKEGRASSAPPTSQTSAGWPDPAFISPRLRPLCRRRGASCSQLRA